MNSFWQIFSIDYRSLRMFRFGLGLFILCDLFFKLKNFSAFYTDAGVVPGALVSTLNKSMHQSEFSLFLFSNSPLWAAFLFAAIAITGVLLILDWQPRWVSLVAFVLALSVSNRNPLVMYGGDQLFRLALLWSVLLPARASNGEKSFSGFVSMGALVQIALLYLSAGLSKDVNTWLFNPRAVELALNSDTYGRPLAQILLAFPNLVLVSTIGVFFIERLGWLIFFSPWRQWQCRIIGFFIFSLMHLGFGLFLEVELFPLIDIVLLCLILPGEFWDRLGVEPAKFQSRNPRRERWVEPLALAYMCVSIYINISSVPQVGAKLWRPIAKIAKTLDITRSWSLFAPSIEIPDRYYRLAGRSTGGNWRDLHSGAFADFWSKPTNPTAAVGGALWTRYFEWVSIASDEILLPPLRDFFCRRELQKNNPIDEIRLIQYIEGNSLEMFQPQMQPLSSTRTVFIKACDPQKDARL